MPDSHGGALRRRGGRRLIVLIGCITGIVIAAGVAYATIPDAGGVVHLCYKDNNGNVRVIDPASSKKDQQACKNDEVALDVNQQGPTGGTGATGATGGTGPAGATGPAGSIRGCRRHRGRRSHRRDGGYRRTWSAGGRRSYRACRSHRSPSGATRGIRGHRCIGPAGPAGAGALWALVRSDGLKIAGSAGVTSSHGHTGVYEIVFPQTVTSCGSSVTSSQYVGSGLIGVNPDFSDPPDVSHAFFSVYFRSGFPSHIVIGEFDKGGTAVDGPFTIAMFCQ